MLIRAILSRLVLSESIGYRDNPESICSSYCPDCEADGVACNDFEPTLQELLRHRVQDNNNNHCYFVKVLYTTKTNSLIRQA